LVTLSPRLLAALAPIGVALFALFAAPAFAADPDPALLFDRGVADMEAGRFESACPAIEQSQKLDPRPGTLFTLAECEAKRGHLAASATRYDEYLALYATLPPDKKLKQGDREKTARAQRALLGPKVAELTLVLPPGTPTGTRVARDGAAVAVASLGAPVVVDPGEHVATTQAPGGPLTEVRIKLGAGEKKAIALEVREPSVTGAPAPPGSAPPPGVTGPNKAVLIAGGAVAGAAAIAGAALAGVHVSKASSASSLYTTLAKTGCPPASADPTGPCGELKSDLDARAATGTASVALFVSAGAIGLGTLIYGLAGGSRSGPSAVVVAPVITAEGGSLFVSGRF
jgi:hypothetical protein